MTGLTPESVLAEAAVKKAKGYAKKNPKKAAEIVSFLAAPTQGLKFTQTALKGAEKAAKSPKQKKALRAARRPIDAILTPIERLTAKLFRRLPS
jgi:hypothetical protein